MDLTSQTPKNGSTILQDKKKMNQLKLLAYVSMVDPFLAEALQNPRHRLSILRMELDIQKFLQNSSLQQFEFPHFPTSYLRLAAHRVAQHYGLLTMVLDNVLDGQGIRILVIKKPETKFPVICLSDVPAKESENDKHDQMKIVIRSRHSGSSNDANKLGHKHSPARTMEERKEDYDRARARIFSTPNSPESENGLARDSPDGDKLNVGENEVSGNLDVDDKRIYSTDFGNSSSVAIFRDKEKDRSDPDYDRSYDRYVKSFPNTQSFGIAPFTLQKFQAPFVQYDTGFPHPSQMAPSQASLNYRSPIMNPYFAMGQNQTYGDALYMQLPSQAVMYAHSYDQLRHSFFQAPFHQQALSFDYSQNY